MNKLILDRNDLKLLNARRSWRERRRVCHIPEKGLYFGLRGQVYTCCFNKTHPIGSYPEQSVSEIWNGLKIKEQQKAIRNNNMSYGCGACYSLIKSSNINGLPIRNYDQYARRNGGMPAKMDFELYNTCNLECIMCRGEFSSSIRKNREHLPALHSPYDSAFYDQVEAFIPSLKSSHFLGGEPFLIPEYIDLWDRMATINPKMALSAQTNCTVLNQRVKDILGRINFHISISLDSVEEANFERIRKNGKFSRVIENLTWFREYTNAKGTLLTMAMCPMPQNWHELPNAIRFCNEWKMPLMFTTVESPTECSLQALSSNELEQIFQTLSQDIPAANSDLERQNLDSFLDLLNQLKQWEVSAKKKESQGIDSKATSFEEYIAQIEQLITFDQGKAIAKIKTQEIRQKLEYIIQFAEDKGLADEASAKIISTPQELIIRSVPGLEAEQLLKLFQGFVFPME